MSVFPVATCGGGQCVAFPDVCKSPPPTPFVPVPYPNIALPTQCDGGTCSSKVKVVGKKVVVKGTEITVSSGDEGGTVGGGVKSSKIKGNAKYMKGSSKVKAEGKEVCYHTSITAQNGGSNANIPPGVQVAPSQTKVTVMP